MMKCSSCKVETSTVYSNSQEKNKCRDCYGTVAPSLLLNQSANNPYKPWLTKAGNDIITNRVVSRDDGRTVIDRRTGKETPPVTRH